MRNLVLAAMVPTLAFFATPAMAVDPNVSSTSSAPQPEYRTTDNGIRYWQGEDGQTYCKKPNGTTGLLIGGVVGVLVGRSIDTRGDRTPGTLLGAVGGALIGRAIERGTARCR